MQRVKIINKSDLPLPQYQTELSAGMDIPANVESTITLQPGERQLIATGLYLEIPPGYEMQIRPRSGLALKHGITVLNSPGTVDAVYRGNGIEACHGVSTLDHDRDLECVLCRCPSHPNIDSSRSRVLDRVVE